MYVYTVTYNLGYTRLWFDIWHAADVGLGVSTQTRVIMSKDEAPSLMSRDVMHMRTLLTH